MTPLYDLNSPPSPFPLEINLNQQHTASASSSSAFFNNIPDDQQPKPYHLKVIDHHMTHDGGSRDQQASSSSSSVLQSATVVDFSLSRKEDIINGDFESATTDDHDNNGSSLKWMSSKMRIMKKIIINSNCSTINIKPENNKFQCPFLDTHEYETNYSTAGRKSNIDAIRVCSDCNTTTTPLWRSGPRGPKSLCNACGIRQRKARRALEVEAAAAVVKDATACLKIKVQKKKEMKKTSGTIHVGEYKKQLKNYPGNNCVHHQMKRELCFKELGLSLREKKNMQQQRRGCPQDVEDAAILLMELSCGLIHT